LDWHIILGQKKRDNMKKILLLLFAALVVGACVKEDFFGYSSFGEIKSIEVSNQASQALINTNTKNVTIEIPGGVDLSDIKIQKLTLSSFATSDLTIGDQINLTDSSIINVIAEDDVSKTTWTLKASVASNTPQVSNSDFNLWYQAAEGYYEPGESATTTVWGTGNPGTKILGLFATTPLEISENNLAVKMETLYNGDLPAGFGTPISAATIYTGKFNPDKIDISNPQAAIDFGTPFAGRPSSFKLKYTFSPGQENKDKQGNILDYSDACDIYLLLEVRNASSSKRLATAWLRSDETVQEVIQLQVPLIYGELPADAPDYAKPPDGGYVRADSAKFILPTHLTFVATSSFDGANFAGAVGSLLLIDDLELVYD
jgi:hypothetical protein